jgi:hypothetical protein
MKKAGTSRRAFLAIGGTVIDGDGTVTTGASKWYLVLKKAVSSGIPEKIPVNTPFKAPASGTQFTLAIGDQLLELDFERYCKTTADWSMEQGSIDVGDDCDIGAQIRDGITTISGSLSGFFQFDDATEQMADVSAKVFNLFVPYLEDDGAGDYSYNPPENPRIYLGLCLNGDAAAGNIENWFLTPVNITSVSASGGNTDGQTMEMSWTKGEGAAVMYEVPRAA